MPVAGCDIGDCGYKLAIDGLDNGWIRFSDFRIPRESLLNKHGDVDAEGNYMTSVEDDTKRFGLHFSSLAGGRCMISRLAADYSLYGATIAMRYTCVRKAFGDPEIPIIEYPMVQHRIFKNFSEQMANYIASQRVMKIWMDNLPNLNDEKNRRNELCHGLGSAAKAFNTWSSQESLNETKRLLGGIGFSAYSQSAIVMKGNDVQQTLEGDNNVLLMQTTKFIFRNLKWKMKGSQIQETCEFLTLDMDNTSIFDNPDLSNVKSLNKMLAFRACFKAHKIGTFLAMNM